MGDPLVIVVNLGTPARPEPDAVRAFLEEFLSDPDVVDFPRWLWRPILHGIVLRRRPARVARLYREIWQPGGSPLAIDTGEIARSLSVRLAGRAEVRCAYRYGSPSLAAELEGALAGDERNVYLVPLFAHRTSSATGTIFRLAAEIAAKSAHPARARRVLLPPDDPGLIEAQAARCETAFAAGGGAPDHLVVSFHGIPERYDRREGGIYRADCEATTRALLERLEWDPERATLCFQSRFGPGRWLAPATATLLSELPSRGVRSAAAVTPGFLTEGLETIEEIGAQGKGIFLAAGGERFLRVPTVAAHPAFVRALELQFDRATEGRA